MAGVLRGEIYWADLNPVRGHEQAGRRPVLVISQDLFNERSGTVIAMALTSQPQRAGYPLSFELPSGAVPVEMVPGPAVVAEARKRGFIITEKIEFT